MMRCSWDKFVPFGGIAFGEGLAPLGLVRVAHDLAMPSKRLLRGHLQSVFPAHRRLRRGRCAAAASVISPPPSSSSDGAAALKFSPAQSTCSRHDLMYLATCSRTLSAIFGSLCRSSRNETGRRHMRGELGIARFADRRIASRRKKTADAERQRASSRGSRRAWLRCARTDSTPRRAPFPIRPPCRRTRPQTVPGFS